MDTLRFDSKVIVFWDPLLRGLGMQKGAQNTLKRYLWAHFSVYFFEDDDFLKNDDSIERNAYFCSVRGAQNATKNR